MVDYITSTTEKDVLDLQDAEDKEAGLPIIGKHVGGGRHVLMDPGDPNSPGWTVHSKGIRKHPTKNEWAYPKPSDDLIAKLESKLPAPALLHSQGKVLTSDWFAEV